MQCLLTVDSSTAQGGGRCSHNLAIILHTETLYLPSSPQSPASVIHPQRSSLSSLFYAVGSTTLDPRTSPALLLLSSNRIPPPVARHSAAHCHRSSPNGNMSAVCPARLPVLRWLMGLPTLSWRGSTSALPLLLLLLLHHTSQASAQNMDAMGDEHYSRGIGDNCSASEGQGCRGSGGPRTIHLGYGGATALVNGGELVYLQLDGEAPLSSISGLFDMLTLETSPLELFSAARLESTQNCSFAEATGLLDLDEQNVAKHQATTQVPVPVFWPLRLAVKCAVDADITLHTKGR